MRTTASVLVAIFAVLIAGAFAVPALGGPSYASIARRLASLDRREARHSSTLNEGLRRVIALAGSKKSLAGTNVRSIAMIPAGNGFYKGRATCSAGEILTGGGVDWGVAPEYAGYQVVSSAPALSGDAWDATVTIGLSPAPGVSPYVYAVCAHVT